MKQIRSIREVGQIVPAFHLAVEPYGEAWIPADAAVPDGFELVAPPAPPAPPTVAELRVRAGELGVELPRRAKKDEIAALVAAAEAAAAAAASDTPPPDDEGAGDTTIEPQAAAAEPTQEETDR